MHSFKVLTLVLSFSAATAQAASLANSPCRGLPEVECKAKEVIQGQKACLWVNGYKTVAGTERKSYCRVSLKRAASN
jgi:hypothetical protein